MDYQGEPSPGAGNGHGYGLPNLYQQSQGSQQTHIHDGLPSGKWDGQTQDMGMQRMYHMERMQELQMQNQYAYQQHQQYTLAPSTTTPHAYYQTPSQPQYHYSQYTEHQQHQVPEFIHPFQPPSLGSNQLQQQVSQPLQQQILRPLQQSSLQQQSSASASKPSAKLPSAPKQPDSQPVGLQTLMVSLAEEYFEAAYSLASDVARNMTAASLDEYQKLIATGLGCLEVVLRKIRLAPKLEARIRLRYAGVLFDETENYMEAETALSRGIYLCDQNHYLDLKYSMQVLLSQILYKKNPKASLKDLERHCKDTRAYQHRSWEYVFRLLKASLSLKSAKTSDHQAALHDLRHVSSLASDRSDHAILILASLMEVLVCLSSPGPESQEQIQRAFAAARTYQLEADARIPQLTALTHILDVTCSLLYDLPAHTIQKQIAMVDIFKSSAWSTSSNTLALPIAKSPDQTQLVSRDTRGILEKAEDGRDALVVSFLNNNDACALIYLLSGISLLHSFVVDGKAIQYLRQGLLSLSDSKGLRKSNSSLSEALEELQWRGVFVCYFHIYLIFCLAAISDWKSVKDHLSKLNLAIRDLERSFRGPLEIFHAYLSAVYLQGIGDLDTALVAFRDPKLHLPNETTPTSDPEQQTQQELAILSTMHVLSILQDDHYRNTAQNNATIARLEPLCIKHPNQDIETAFKLLKAVVLTEPPIGITKTKNYLSSALNTAKATSNRQFICITLSTLYSKFFIGHAGDQSEKAARAAVRQAKMSRNTLWTSVATGMLAPNLELQGKNEEAQATKAEASRLAALAFPKPS